MTADAAQKPLLSVAEAGHELGIGTRTAYEWLRRGELPGAVQHGGRWYVRRAVLLAYINGDDVRPAGEGDPGQLTHDVARHGGRASGEGR